MWVERLMRNKSGVRESNCILFPPLVNICFLYNLNVFLNIMSSFEHLLKNQTSISSDASISDLWNSIASSLHLLDASLHQSSISLNAINILLNNISTSVSQIESLIKSKQVARNPKVPPPRVISTLLNRIVVTRPGQAPRTYLDLMLSDELKFSEVCRYFIGPGVVIYVATVIGFKIIVVLSPWWIKILYFLFGKSNVTGVTSSVLAQRRKYLKRPTATPVSGVSLSSTSQIAVDGNDEKIVSGEAGITGHAGSTSEGIRNKSASVISDKWNNSHVPPWAWILFLVVWGIYQLGCSLYERAQDQFLRHEGGANVEAEIE